jgi:hypothetical protein
MGFVTMIRQVGGALDAAQLRSALMRGLAVGRN